jgi:hypothetical protein
MPAPGAAPRIGRPQEHRKRIVHGGNHGIVTVGPGFRGHARRERNPLVAAGARA